MQKDLNKILLCVYSSSQCSAKERELLEELASLNGSPIARTKTQPKVQQAGMHEIFSSFITSGTYKYTCHGIF